MKSLLVNLSYNPAMGDDSVLPLFFVLIAVGIVGVLALYILPVIIKKKSKKSKDKINKE